MSCLFESKFRPFVSYNFESLNFDIVSHNLDFFLSWNFNFNSSNFGFSSHNLDILSYNCDFMNQSFDFLTQNFDFINCKIT